MMRNIDYEKKRPIIEVFNSIEGEGNTAGEATIFVRLSGCNLRCCFDNSICDTAYSSFAPEKGKYNYQSVVDIIEKYPMTTALSISGGEPFLHPDVVTDLIEIANDYCMDVLIETNGTLLVDKSILKEIDLINISPKLSSSEPTDEKLKKLGMEWSPALKKHTVERFNIEALWNMIEHAKDFSLKYVVSRKEDFKEIEKQIHDLMLYDIQKKSRKRYSQEFNGTEIWFDTRFINPWNITLMPAGSRNDELDQNRQMVAEYCAEHGYRYSDRLQIIIWGTKRGV